MSQFSVRGLHWITTRQSIEFEFSRLIHNCLTGCAALYIWELSVSVFSIFGHRILRCATVGDTEALYPKDNTQGNIQNSGESEKARVMRSDN